MIIFTVVLISQEASFKSLKSIVIPTRGFGKRSVHLNDDNVPKMTLKRGLGYLPWSKPQFYHLKLRGSGPEKKEEQDENQVKQKLFFRIH